jgi:hypothetical protein
MRFSSFRISTIEQDDEIEEVESVGGGDEEDREVAVPVDDGQIKLFSCPLCAVSFSKFEGYHEHFISTEHRYKRRDEKKRLGVSLNSLYLIINNHFVFFLGRLYD